MLRTRVPEVETDRGDELDETPVARERAAGGTNSAAAVHARRVRQLRAGSSSSTPEQTNGTGQAMPASVRGKMERSFGADFSDVRVHRDTSMGALAYTQGDDIHFAPGQFAPETAKGQELIGHELAHVVQQRSGAASAQAKSEGGVSVNADPALEAEADVAGARAARGEPAQVTGAAAGGVQMKEPEKANVDAVPDIDGKDIADSVELSEEVKTQFYAHGGFMGAAPEMLKDPMWNRILKVLMPDVYTETWSAIQALQGRGGEAPGVVEEFKSVISMFENNPVMSAYGVWKTEELDKADEARGEKTFDRTDAIDAFEWDAFLPSDTVALYKKATESEKPSLAADIVKEMVIAHGTKMQTVLETGLGRRQYDSVQNTAKTNYGGVKPGEWMDLFARALELAGSGDGFERVYGAMKDELRHRDEHKSDDWTFRDLRSPKDAIDQYKKVFGDRLFSVILDVKSRDATPEILNAVTRELNSWGVHVAGYGSFVFSEIDGVEEQKQVIGGKEAPAAKAIKFLHMVGSVHRGIADGSIKDGDHVMFNASSLLSYDKGKKGKELADSYRVNETVVAELRTLKLAHSLNIGLYVQEPDIDPKAVDLLTALANDERATFNMGFAWGGLSDRASGEIETADETPRLGYGGQESFVTARWWKNNNPEVQRAALELWARHGSTSLRELIQSQTDIKFKSEVSDRALIESYPVVIEDYSMWRDIKFSSVQLDLQPAEGSDKAAGKLVMKLKMLGGTTWDVTGDLEVPMGDLSPN